MAKARSATDAGCRPVDRSTGRQVRLLRPGDARERRHRHSVASCFAKGDRTPTRPRSSARHRAGRHAQERHGMGHRRAATRDWPIRDDAVGPWPAFATCGKRGKPPCFSPVPAMTGAIGDIPCRTMPRGGMCATDRVTARLNNRFRPTCPPHRHAHILAGGRCEHRVARRGDRGQDRTARYDLGRSEMLRPRYVASDDRTSCRHVDVSTYMFRTVRARVSEARRGGWGRGATGPSRP